MSIRKHKHNYNHLSKEDKKTYGIKQSESVWKCLRCGGFYYEL